MNKKAALILLVVVVALMLAPVTFAQVTPAAGTTNWVGVAAAIPSAIAAATPTQFVVPAAGVTCANVTGASISATTTTSKINAAFLFMSSPRYEFAARRWLPEVRGDNRSHTGSFCCLTSCLL